MSSKTKRTLTLKEKIDITEFQDKAKVSVRGLGNKFHIAKTQAANMIKYGNKLLKDYQCNLTQKRQFLRKYGYSID